VYNNLYSVRFNVNITDFTLPKTPKTLRKKAVSDRKKDLILAAARLVFERDGLAKASLRAIAKEAGYTPAALYFHFDSKQAIYAELLAESLEVLQQTVEHATHLKLDPQDKYRAAATAYFQFFLQNPRDLDLGFYLSSGGMSREGVGRHRNEQLNAQLLAAIQPIETAALTLSGSIEQAKRALTEYFVYANGILLLVHTGRIKLFDLSESELLDNFISCQLEILIPESKTAYA